MKNSADKFLCPRCFKRQDSDSIVYICSNTSKCQLAIDKTHQHPKKKKNKNTLCEECGRILVIKLCPKCDTELPLNIGVAKSCPISIIGAKGAGKSNYLAVLLHQLENEIGRAFNCAFMACGDNTLNRYRREFYEPVYRQRTCVTGADVNESDPLLYSLIFQRRSTLFKKMVNDALTLTFLDIAGDDFNSSASVQNFNSYLYFSFGIILLLDPLQLPSIRDELQEKISLPEENSDVNTEPKAILNRLIEAIRTVEVNVSGSEIESLSKKIDIPIAVTFSKIDVIGELLDPASHLQNESTHIEKGFFDKIDFNNTNSELQGLVESWVGQEFYQTLSTHFTNFAFFGLSALGSSPKPDGKIAKFHPFRVADPFLWILAQAGVIPAKFSK